MTTRGPPSPAHRPLPMATPLRRRPIICTRSPTLLQRNATELRPLPSLPKPHPPVNGGGGGGGSSPPTDLSRRSLERQRKPTKPLVGSIGGHARHKSNELDLSTIRHRTGSSEHLSPHHHQQQLTQHYHPPTSSTEELYAMPLRKNRKPPVVAPKPRQVPSPIPPSQCPVLSVCNVS